jgi:hypothetical protein
MHFPRLLANRNLGLDAFIEAFDKCCQKWLAKAAECKSQLDKQRNLIIETDSCFN